MAGDDWRHISLTDLGEMTSRPLTPERFPDMEEIFGERGVARRCFCMYWRRPDGGFDDERDNRDRFVELVERDGLPPGLLGYVEGRPLGWVQVGPRRQFPTMARSRLVGPVDDREVWSINCFVIATGHRRRGLGTGLAAAAVAFATDQGAHLIEAYPVEGPRSGATTIFTGTTSMFRPHGFEEVARRKETRPILRLQV